MCFVTVPHPLGMISKEEVNAKVDAAFDDIVKAATAWTPSKEKQDAQVKPYPAKRFKFSGTYADVNDMFQKRKWSLSLPIVPPTVDKVAAMLKGTKRNPAEVLWVVPPRQGMLTVELVAALGVMAADRLISRFFHAAARMGEAHGNAPCRDESAARVGMERKK